MLVCHECNSDDIDLAERLDDGRIQVVCLSCGHTWIRGTAKVVTSPVDTFAVARKRLPGPENVEPAQLARVEDLKQEFLRRKPEPRPEVVQHGADTSKYSARMAFANAIRGT